MIQLLIAAIICTVARHLYIQHKEAQIFRLKLLNDNKHTLHMEVSRRQPHENLDRYPV